MVEETNKVTVNNLKWNLEEKKGSWLEELPRVLWVQRTTQKEAIRECHLSLVYRTEAGLLTLTTFSGRGCFGELEAVGEKC